MVENAEASRVALYAYTGLEEPSMLFDAYTVGVTLSIEQRSVNAVCELSGERMRGEKNECNLSCIITVSHRSAHTFEKKKVLYTFLFINCLWQADIFVMVPGCLFAQCIL